MPISSNQLRQQVDLPVWEWLRAAPLAATSGVSCSCSADNSNFSTTAGRFIYYLINATNFWRYDTVSDTYEQLATPVVAPLTATSMRYAGGTGYYNRVISATSTTITSGVPFGGLGVGFKIRIISGTGAGQERVITDISDPIIADSGNATAGTVTNITDTNKNWFLTYTGASGNVNGYAGYMVRVLYGTGLGQARKILYNTSQILTVGDNNIIGQDPFASAVFTTAPAAGSFYQIHSNVITVDTAWDTVPDSSSRFVIQSGGIYMISGAATLPFFTIQYYDILADTWYAKTSLQNIVQAAPTDVSLERITENSSIWWQGIATAGTTTTLTDIDSGWTTNQWANYYLYIYSGTGRGQITKIISNTSSILTFSALATAPDTTSKYTIIGYDAGTSSGSNSFNTLVDSSKTWTTDQYKNFGVRIVAGTGAGQLRQILSNTATTLTLYTGWNVLPDNTSIYVIQGYSQTQYFTWGGSAETFLYNASDIDMPSHGRITDSGIAAVAAALVCNSTHVIAEQPPIALTSLSGTTTITATSAQPHGLRTGQYVSIRGVTSAANDQFNVTGLVQITGVPSITTFTYTPFAAGSGTYAYLTALSTTNLSDASKEFRDTVSSATTTSITFARRTPSNINGWYVSGTNVTPGTIVVSGGGTTTVTLSSGAAVPSGIISFSAWAPHTAITSTFSSGGGAGVATITLTGATNANINGWYVVGTGIALNTYVTSGAGTTTLVLSNACTGAVSGTITFYPPRTAGKLSVMSLAAPATSGNTTGQLMVSTTPVGATTGFIAALGAAPVATLSKYVLSNIEMPGSTVSGTAVTYNSGIATSGSTTTLVDASSFWATATGTGSAQGTTITLSAVSPGNINGWYVTGTGINTGTQIVSGAGTNTLTVDIPFSGAVSGTITCAAFGQNLVNRRLKILSGATGLNQEVIITAVAPTTGTLTFATGTAPINNVAAYSILSSGLKSTGQICQWQGGGTVPANRGRYLWMQRGGASAIFEKIDLVTDRVVYVTTSPQTETFTSGTMWAYDQQDRIYFTKDLTNRCYYLDLNTNWIYGAGLFPYLAGATGIGNKMEVFTTADGLKYLWLVRQQQVEAFRQLIFY